MKYQIDILEIPRGKEWIDLSAYQDSVIDSWKVYNGKIFILYYPLEEGV